MSHSQLFCCVALLLQAARAGLAEGLQPTLAKAGTGGSYFLQDVQGKPVAVFKPEDEEPHAVNNPKGRTGSSSDGSSGAGSGSEGLRRGTRPGEGAVREVAAYVLDHDHFAGEAPCGYACIATEEAKQQHSNRQAYRQDGRC
jgi:hypothetical protein